MSTLAETAEPAVRPEGTVGAVVPAPPTLRRLAVAGGLWTLGGYGAAVLLRLASNVVLTRLLFPEAFGIMLAVNVFLAGLQLFTDLGIGASIIRSPRGTDPGFLRTAWTVQVVRGVVLWGIGCALAWPYARFYQEPALGLLICVASASAFLDGLTPTGFYTLNRDLHLARITLLELVSQVAAILVMVAWAALEPSVWALAAGGVVGAAVRVAGAWLVLPARDRLGFEPAAWRELWTFGVAVFASTGLLFVAEQSERLLMPAFLRWDAVGVYAVALGLASMGTQAVQAVMGRVVYPALSRLYREDPGRAVARYRLMRLGTEGAGGLAALGLMLAGPLVVWLLYDSRYQAAGWMLRVLAVQALFDIVRAPAAWLLLAAGKPRYGVWAHAARAAVVWGGLPIVLAAGDMLGAVSVIALSSGAAGAVYFHGVSREFPAARARERVAGWAVLVLGVALVVALNLPLWSNS
ncbi:MAG TPA: oligosaccharide flippase family protein [Phycisphaerales bacterium]|nr:oligosaccharide flippase family protein [Phycisphaerales bacterium]